MFAVVISSLEQYTKLLFWTPCSVGCACSVLSMYAFANQNHAYVVIP